MINTYETILFDLDGTLTDSKPGIIRSVQYALKHYGITEQDINVLERFIGPPLVDSFMEYYNFSKAEAFKAIEKYREYFTATGIFENSVYEGIDELLNDLVNAGRRLIIATSKPSVFTEKILEYFDLKKYFCFISGSNLDGSRMNKDEVIGYALSETGIKASDSVIMIGDRKHDIIGAKKMRLKSAGVLYGYGSREELEAYEPTHIADSVMRLKELLLCI